MVNEVIEEKDEGPSEFPAANEPVRKVADDLPEGVEEL